MSVGMNTAVSACDPTTSAEVEVVADAMPLVTVAGVPKGVVPSMNCTVPTATGGVTAAISVTGAPWAIADGVSAALATCTAVAWATSELLAGAAPLDSPT